MSEASSGQILLHIFTDGFSWFCPFVFQSWLKLGFSWVFLGFKRTVSCMLNNDSVESNCMLEALPAAPRTVGRTLARPGKGSPTE